MYTYTSILPLYNLSVLTCCLVAPAQSLPSSGPILAVVGGSYIRSSEGQFLHSVQPLALLGPPVQRRAGRQFPNYRRARPPLVTTTTYICVIRVPVRTYEVYLTMLYIENMCDITLLRGKRCAFEAGVASIVGPLTTPSPT